MRNGHTATFEDLWEARGKESIDPKKHREPAEPFEASTGPINEKLTDREWDFLDALNQATNTKVHLTPIPEVNGKMKLILPNDFYNPTTVEKVLRKLEIIEPEEPIVFQPENEASSGESEKSSSTTGSENGYSPTTENGNFISTDLQKNKFNSKNYFQILDSGRK